MKISHISLALGFASLLAASMGGCSSPAEEPVSESDEALVATPMAAESPWATPEACEAALGAGKHMRRRAGAARVATWNLHWFPDGVMPDSGARLRPTNLAWLACSIAWLGVDVLAVEEVLTHPRAKAAMQTLLSRLDELTGGDWRAEIDPCPHPDAQHQGFLYDARRVTASSLRTFDWRDGDHCDLSMRPGYAGYFRVSGGVDFHMVAVHQKSGVDRRSFGLRREALAALGTLSNDAREAVADEDVIVTGDYNSMGCVGEGCSEVVDAATEISRMDDEARAAGFRRAKPNLLCSQYTSGRAGLLDHFVVSRTMSEVGRSVHATVSGYCAELACAPIPPGSQPRAQREVSDHCPVVLEIDGRDQD